MAELYNNSLYSDANLIAYYRFEGNSNATVGGTNGTDSSMSYASTTPLFGQYAVFNGSGYFTLADGAAVQPSGDCTINYWAKDMTGSYIACKDDVTSNRDWNANVGSWFFFINDSTNSNRSFSTSTYNDGAWHFYSGVYDSATGNIDAYIDGVLSNGAGTANAGALNNTTSLVYVGKRNYVPDPGNITGKLDDFSIFSRKLTSAEINSLFQTKKNLTLLGVS